MYFVYILQSQKDKSYYTGITQDINKRIREHNQKTSKYSSTKSPFNLKWYCVFNEKEKASKFEKYIKSGSGYAFARKRLL